MKPFSLLVKPASADCNLGCEYCFYLSRHSLYPGTNKHRMSDPILERVIKTYMETKQPGYSICWQGGEPALMGVDFFSKAIEFQKKYGSFGARISNSVQTNATCITDKMAALFARYKFLVGCSLDGPEEIHNLYRKTTRGKPTHKDVIKGIEILKKHQVLFNILTLVSQANIAHGPEVYHYLKKKGFLYHQYIPCVEFDGKENLKPFAITGKEWGRFLCSVFDSWYPEDPFSVSVRNFDSILSKKIDGISDVCVMGDNCCQYFVVEYNGDIYPCDFFVEKPLKLGNIMENSWEEMIESSAYKDFGAQKTCWNEKCTACDYLELCAGDCLKNRTYSGNSPQNLSWLCTGWEKFFKHTNSRFGNLSEKIKQQRQNKQVHKEPFIKEVNPKKTRGIDKTLKLGRNDPCSCGSGIKFKKCCGK